MNAKTRLTLLAATSLLLAACGQTATSSTPTLTPAPAIETQSVAPVVLTVGQTRQLIVYVSGRPATPSDVTWRSTHTAVASVSENGLVSAKGAGSATVRVALRSNPAVYLDFPIQVNAVSTTPPPAPGAPSDFEKQVLDLTNVARAQGRVCGTKYFPAAAPLTYNANLRQAAYLHSQDMAVNNFFSHTGSNGSTMQSRVAAAAYTNWRALGENIAAGQSTPEAVVNGWLNSPGHCQNIMNAAFTELGVGYTQGGSYRHYWTQDFGAR